MRVVTNYKNKERNLTQQRKSALIYVLLYIFMNSSNNSVPEWKYLTPEYPNGECSFAGLPCPTQRALEELGEEGIEEIDKKIKEMIKWKKTLYGKDSDRLGFDHIQYFINELGDRVRCFGQVFYADRKMYAYPERSTAKGNIDKSNYVIDYSKKVLKDINVSIEE